MSLIERLDASVTRLEELADRLAERGSEEHLLFDASLPVLLPDGSLKVHHWMKFQAIGWHRSDDRCPTMTVAEYRDWLANTNGIALASG